MTSTPAPFDKHAQQIEKLHKERAAALSQGLPTTEFDSRIRELTGQQQALAEEKAESLRQRQHQK